MIECNGADGDDSLARPRRGIGHLALLQPLDAAVFADYDRFHGGRF